MNLNNNFLMINMFNVILKNLSKICCHFKNVSKFILNRFAKKVCATLCTSVSITRGVFFIFAFAYLF